MSNKQRKYISRDRMVLTLPHELTEKIREMAEQEGRTLGKAVERWIIKGMAAPELTNDS